MRKRFTQAKSVCGERAHIERTKGTFAQAADYCRKDGDYREYGERPSSPGARSDITAFCDYVRQYHGEHGTRPPERTYAVAFPALYVRYPRALRSLSDHLCPRTELLSVGECTLRGWQSELWEYLNEEPDDRTVRFYVDDSGGKGKTWMIRYLLTKCPDKTQMIGIGKRDDLAYSIDETKRWFLFNVPRGQMEFLRYEVLEQLKDRLVFSPKYHSGCKVLLYQPHVVVFSNEDADRSKMSRDRFKVIRLI